MANENVLLVEDDADIRELLSYTLKREGYVVEECDSAESARSVLRRRTLPDLILLDTNMPGMNGHQMLEHLRADPVLKHTPVIMLTARCEPQDIAAASARGISDYVTKPFDFAQLMDKIHAVLKDQKDA